MRQDHGRPGRRRLIRRAWRTAVALCVIAAVIALAGYPVYVRPQLDPLRKADAILVLGGPGYGRYPLGFELGTQKWAPVVVVSNPNGARDPWLAEQCRRPQTFELRCFVPDPSTTKGEGRELRSLADQHGWHTVIVVTFKPHISRARFILEQCFAGQLIMFAPADRLPAWRWPVEYFYQTVGYLRALLQPGC